MSGSRPSRPSNPPISCPRLPNPFIQSDRVRVAVVLQGANMVLHELAEVVAGHVRDSGAGDEQPQ